MASFRPSPPEETSPESLLLITALVVVNQKTKPQIHHNTPHRTHHTARNTQNITHHTQGTTADTRGTTHSTPHTTHDTQRTTRNAQRTTHNTQPTTHNTRHITHNLNANAEHEKPQVCICCTGRPPDSSLGAPKAGSLGETPDTAQLGETLEEGGQKSLEPEGPQPGKGVGGTVHLKDRGQVSPGGGEGARQPWRRGNIGLHRCLAGTVLPGPPGPLGMAAL